MHSLNKPQLDAVLHDDGPLLVLAGAGSGKTRVIIYRIARMLRDGVPPERILGVTFTNKAAREMRERLTALAGPCGKDVLLSTFHSLALRILREEPEHVGLEAGFCIYDTGDQMGLLREFMRHMHVADRRLDVQRVLELILRTKRERKKKVEIRYDDDYEIAAYELYDRYIAQMLAFNAVDFDDLILKAQDALDVPEVRERWSQRFHYLLVDEYQDTSPDQLALLKALAGERRNVCVVGDDDQSIYGWRGAAADNILNFSRQFGRAKEVVLDQNYRSTGSILEVANQVIKNNAVRKPKTLWSSSGPGDAVEVIACSDGDDEAEYVIGKISALMQKGTRAGQIAILYRANAQSRVFEEGLAVERIPFVVVGGQAFFERKEVRDAIAYLAVIQNPRDEISLRRIVNWPARGIGATSLQRLVRHGQKSGKGLWGALTRAQEVEDLPQVAVQGAEQLMSVLLPMSRQLRLAKVGELASLSRTLFDKLGMRQSILSADDAPSILSRRLENLEEVVRSIDGFEKREPPSNKPALGEYLHSAALAQLPSEEEDKSGCVTLMTLHSAKGLEFDYVFFVGVEEDTLPHKKSIEEGGELSEERRLCYVGMTRAKKRLWMTWARRRKRHGGMQDRGASRFLAEIQDGPFVNRRDRDNKDRDEESDQLAQDFFSKMRSSLGIEE
ncbi:MAG: hypothetical protein A2341_20525 [Deltaproteobacteria bacterium RIFOXYB12_FULL_58_9]|nr:MAG: hypothetical protein A2341_20525 [Deltaproteobacteria bacterium RIFOXYB12_FULL_58_9]